MAHGKTGYVTVGSTTWCAIEWSVTGSMEEVDVTTFCSLGVKEFEAGVEEWEGSVTMYTTVGNIMGLTAGVVLGNEDCEYSGSILFNSHEATNPVGDMFESTWGFKFNGVVSIS